MHADLRTLLLEAAPEPTTELDLDGVFDRGRRLARRRRVGAAAGLAAALTAVTILAWPGAEPPPPTVVVGSPLDQGLRRDLDDRFAEVVEALGVPGAAAAIVFDDGAVWTATAGRTADAAGTSVGSSTAFSLDHLTELVTMATIADLIDDGVLSSDDPVTRWLPDLRTTATIGDLLHHRSGLPDVTVSLGADWQADPEREWTADEVLAAGVPNSLPPGGDLVLNDTDAIVLGRIVEVADGRSLPDSARARILEPLAAGSVGFQPLDRALVARPSGIEVDPFAHDLVPWTAWATADAAATGMVGTVEDTARLLHALLTSEVAAPWRATLLDWRANPEDRRPPRGAAGLVRGSHDGWREVWRASTRGTPGYRASMLHVPDLRATVVVMANRGHERTDEGFVADGPDLLDGVAEVLLDATVSSASAAITARTQVWVADPDGSNSRPLTDWPGQVVPLDWSPDGRWVLVQSDRDGDWDLWLAAADGSEVRQVTDEPGLESLARFSPDGTRIAFTDNLAVDADLWVVGIDGQGMTKVAGGVGTDEWNPAWSPDGTTLLFTRSPRDRPQGSELWASEPDGTGARRIDVGGLGILWADWNGDASRLVGGTADGGLVTFRPDGTDVALVAGVDLAWHPRWAPDGTITFARGGTLGADGLLGAGPGDPRDLWRVTSDGSNASPLLERPGDQSLPVWSPDGRLVAFADTPEDLP